MLCLYEKTKNNDKMQSGYNLGGGNSRTFLELSTTRYPEMFYHVRQCLCLCSSYKKLLIAILPGWASTRKVQEAQLSPRDRAMRRVNWNLANCHATVQKLLIRQLLTKSMVWSWKFSRRQCVIDRQCALNHDATESLSLSQMCHKQTDHGRLVDITCIPTTTCCGEIF